MLAERLEKLAGTSSFPANRDIVGRVVPMSKLLSANGRLLVIGDAGSDRGGLPRSRVEEHQMLHPDALWAATAETSQPLIPDGCCPASSGTGPITRSSRESRSKLHCFAFACHPSGEAKRIFLTRAAWQEMVARRISALLEAVAGRVPVPDLLIAGALLPIREITARSTKGHRAALQREKRLGRGARKGGSKKRPDESAPRTAEL